MKKGIIQKGIYTIVIGGLFTIGACKKTETVYQPYTVPASYNFENVEYAEATARVNMWSGLTSYLGKAAGATPRQLSQDTANYLWNNTNSAFTAETVVNLPNTYTALNAMTGINVSGKSANPTIIKTYIDSMIKVSLSYNIAASNGTAGKIGSRIFNYSGLEFNQLVAKGLMGSFVMNEVINLLNKVSSDDNNTVVAGKGTAMQHDWDMAFGYISLPKIYDSSITYASSVVDRPLALGGYFRERGRYIQAGGKVHTAFIKGRAAIGAKDYATRDAAIATIKEYMEKTLAAAAYEYAGKGYTDGTIDSRFHSLSEGYGFILALKYRSSNSPLTEANYQTLSDIFKTNFYVLDADASHAKLIQVRSILTSAYGQLQP